MKYPASHLTPFPPTFPGKTTCKRILSAKNSARAPAIPLSTFRMNTCKSVSKQRTLSPFRMNTYAKTGGRGVLLLTISAQCRCRGRASARLAKRSKRSSPSPAFHPLEVDLRSLCSHEPTSCPSISSICIPCVFIHLQIAFFATRLFSKTSALSPSFSKSGQNPLPTGSLSTTHYSLLFLMLS